MVCKSFLVKPKIFNLNTSDGKEAKQVINQTANDVNLVKRLSSPSPLTFHCRDRLHLVGDQLRWELQHWLSPPDPSTNQNFVQKARHSGTAAWFFESNALAEWQARGSLLWIHSKRMFSNRQRASFFTNNLLILKRGQGRVRFCKS
jgi:hypothetical protein